MPKKKNIPAKSDDSTGLFNRVVTILEQARANVVRTVNSEMVIAYWLIGREIVQDLQGGDERAEYGKRLVEDLSYRLTERYGKGFSATNLKYFRTFYTTFTNRLPEIGHPTGDQSVALKKGRPMDSQSPKGFHPNLSWSQYRAIMRVEKPEAREFYESEAVCNAVGTNASLNGKFLPFITSVY